MHGFRLNVSDFFITSSILPVTNNYIQGEYSINPMWDQNMYNRSISFKVLF